MLTSKGCRREESDISTSLGVCTNTRPLAPPTAGHGFVSEGTYRSLHGGRRSGEVRGCMPQAEQRGEGWCAGGCAVAGVRSVGLMVSECGFSVR